MSALADEPDDFVRWSGAAPGDFVPRSVYGSYLEATLTRAHGTAAPGVLLQLVCGEAVATGVDDAGVRVELRDGREIRARAAVLALGNSPSADLAVPDGGLYGSALYRRSPWERGALDGIPPAATVLLLGSGLTMVDAALSLQRRGHRGPIHALSRHGVLPHVHADVDNGPLQPRIGASGVRGLLRALRSETQRQGEWRAVFDALRPVTQRFWSRLSHADRVRFLRHLRTFWDVHRHRMAPDVGSAISALRARGRLRVHAGRVRSFAIRGDSAVAVFQPRGQRRSDEISAARVVNCTGPASCLSDMRHPLLVSLLSRGLAVPDALGMGLSTDADGALLGAARGRLFTLGALRRGELWETTAIPELRVQACAVAERLVDDLAVPASVQATV